MTLSKDHRDYEERLHETHGRNLSTAVLMLYVDSCKQLPSAKAGITSKPSPVVQVSLMKPIQTASSFNVNIVLGKHL